MSLLDAAVGERVYALYEEAEQISNVAIQHFHEIDEQVFGVPRALHDRAVELHRNLCAMPLLMQVNVERVMEVIAADDLRFLEVPASKLFSATAMVVKDAAEIASIRARIFETADAWVDGEAADAAARRHCAAIRQFVVDMKACGRA